jgi:hypothetical protein
MVRDASGNIFHVSDHIVVCGEVHPNGKGTLTLQLAVPASGYDLADALVTRARTEDTEVR